MGRLNKKGTHTEDADEQNYNDMVDKTQRLRDLQIAKVTQKQKREIEELRKRIEQKQRAKLIKSLEKKLGPVAAKPFVQQLRKLDGGNTNGAATTSLTKGNRLTLQFEDEGHDSDLSDDERSNHSDSEDITLKGMTVGESDEDSDVNNDDDMLISLKAEFPEKPNFSTNYLPVEEIDSYSNAPSKKSTAFNPDRQLANVYGDVNLDDSESDEGSDQDQDTDGFKLPSLIKKRYKRGLVTKDPATREAIKLPRRHRNLLTHMSEALREYKDCWVTEANYQSIGLARVLAVTQLGTHVYNSLFRHWSNNLEIRQKSLSNSAAMAVHGEDKFKDSGFSKARGLIITPTCQSVKEVTEVLMSLRDSWAIKSRTRFGFLAGSISRDEYMKLSAGDISTLAHYRESGEELRKKKRPLIVSEDFISYFRGNNDESMVIGVKFVKDCVQLCTELDKSDIIIGTIAGLKAMLEGGVYPKGGPAWPKGTVKTRSYPDALCSIESLVIDRAEQLEFQDPEGFQMVLSTVNKDPTKSDRGQDIRRLHPKWLDAGVGARYRQTTILSQGIPEETGRYFLGQCNNFRGAEVLSYNYEKGVSHLANILHPNAIRLHSKLVSFVPITGPQEQTSEDESMGEETSEEELEEEECLFHDLLLKKFAFPLTEQDQTVVIVLRDVISFYNLIAAIDTSRGQIGPLDYQCLHEDIQDPDKMIRSVAGRMSSGKLGALIVTERFLLYNAPVLRNYDHLIFWGSPTHEDVALKLIENLPQERQEDQATEVDRKALCMTFAFDHEPRSNQRWLGK